MARKASLQYKDRPMPPLEEAVYWVEYILRHDTNIFKIHVVELAWYQYMLLDVALMVTLIAVFTVWIIYRLFNLLRSKLKNVSEERDNTTNKTTVNKKTK